jgi:hypothetical protein
MKMVKNKINSGVCGVLVTNTVMIKVHNIEDAGLGNDEVSCGDTKISNYYDNNKDDNDDNNDNDDHDDNDKDGNNDNNNNYSNNNDNNDENSKEELEINITPKNISEKINFTPTNNSEMAIIDIKENIEPNKMIYDLMAINDKKRDRNTSKPQMKASKPQLKSSKPQLKDKKTSKISSYFGVKAVVHATSAPTDNPTPNSNPLAPTDNPNSTKTITELSNKSMSISLKIDDIMVPTSSSTTNIDVELKVDTGNEMIFNPNPPNYIGEIKTIIQGTILSPNLIPTVQIAYLIPIVQKDHKELDENIENPPKRRALEVSDENSSAGVPISNGKCILYKYICTYT